EGSFNISVMVTGHFSNNIRRSFRTDGAAIDYNLIRCCFRHDGGYLNLKVSYLTPSLPVLHLRLEHPFSTDPVFWSVNILNPVPRQFYGNGIFRKNHFFFSPGLGSAPVKLPG